MNLHDRDIMRVAKKEGLEQGAHDKSVEAARNFLANGVSIEIIAKSLNMPVAEIEEIVKAN